MPSENIDYFRARALEERERAAAAADPAIRAVHLDFAGRYEAAAGQLRSDRELKGSRAAVERSLHLLKTTGRQATRIS